MLDGFKFGFGGELKIELVGADVPDGPIPFQLDSLLGNDYLRGVGTSPPTFGSFNLPDKQQFYA